MSAQPRGRFSSRLPYVVGLGAVALLVFGAVGWAVNAQIEGAVIAPGQIVVDRNRQAVQHRDGGIVDEVLIREGDSVVEDQVLIRLDPTEALSELAIVESRLYELMARRGRLEAERDGAEEIRFDPKLLAISATNPEVAELIEGQTRLFEARRETLQQGESQMRNQQEQLKNQIDGIDAQMVASERQIVLIGEETVTQQSLLDRGLTQTARVLNLRREDARLSGLQGELVARRAQAMERYSEIDIELLGQKAQRREDAIAMLRDILVNELENRERRETLLTRLERMEIRAPVAGIIYNLQVFGPRSVVTPAEPLMFLVPQDRPLVIEARVNVVDVDKVASRQQVSLRFQAFSMRDTPDLMGEVMRISPDSFEDQATGRSYYRVEIALSQSELDKLGPDQILIPGMPVDCFIRTGEHTPFAYLTEPLINYLSRAMRESS
ncbi:MAG: HlyD family secretion protein [Rhodobacteraceae bacterium HLUCCO07]|nr:MAG: HlyD family secretion protein [Rhodobacteraceae bacterium HLUCCO07]